MSKLMMSLIAISFSAGAFVADGVAVYPGYCSEGKLSAKCEDHEDRLGNPICVCPTWEALLENSILNQESFRIEFAPFSFQDQQ